MNETLQIIYQTKALIRGYWSFKEEFGWDMPGFMKRNSGTLADIQNFMHQITHIPVRSDEMWLLTQEDGDGNWWGFCGLYASRELAYEYAKKLYHRDLGENEKFNLTPSKNFLPELDGGYVIVDYSWDVVIERPRGAWTIYNIEKVEVTKE